jgi:hypothetical protein
MKYFEKNIYLSLKNGIFLKIFENKIIKTKTFKNIEIMNFFPFKFLNNILIFLILSNGIYFYFKIRNNNNHGKR